MLTITIFVYIISNFLYRKLTKELKAELNFESDSSFDIWDMVKEESKKGNVKAIIAAVCYILEILCMSVVGIMFLLMNI
ncbi:hypothetical protein [Neisseria sp. 83E34]|uniref:hypothetical protein n=1 Tax=Neisseria sp. 83E34 TaxID=1692264 RepID=UPI0006CE8D7F|nr:hypothetical protein [Neisseria sp. 83E34]KPN71519.1 hypothetical protein AKG09_06580 [Neisseria sp. 83E34]